MRKNTLVAALAVVVLALFLVACSDSKITSPTAPTTPVTPNTPPISISVDYFAPSVGSTLTVGMEGVIASGGSGGTPGQSSTIAVVLIRDDGLARIVGCVGWTGNITTFGNTFIKLKSPEEAPKGVYVFAKGHVINATVLAAPQGSPQECYFWGDANVDPRPVAFDRATVRKDVVLNWRVE